MAKKIDRKMKQAGDAQRKTEKSVEDKFSLTQQLAESKPIAQTAHQGRISPQLSCTVLPDDRQLLNELTLFASNKAGKILNTSIIIRALIRLGHRRKEELEF